ncbi:MAG: hypothetical protein U0232_27950 [Thermomicrobiales bacterium]
MRKVFDDISLISFLDLTPIERGSTSAEALRNATALAQLAERLGYHRLWYAEHHNTTGLASSAPGDPDRSHWGSSYEPDSPGSGGVMLPNHAPLRIIEAFRLLEALHPGRIDLGLGRAPGTDTLTAFAMEAARGHDGGRLPGAIGGVDRLRRAGLPAGAPFSKIKAVLGLRCADAAALAARSSDFSAVGGQRGGVGFAFAGHINRGGAVPAMRWVPGAVRPRSGWRRCMPSSRRRSRSGRWRSTRGNCRASTTSSCCG